MLVPLKIYHKSKVVQALTYMQHRHMICGKFHIYHDLVLYQNVNDNTYSTPLLREALDVDHKMVIFAIGLYHDKFSLICVKNQRYPERDTLYLSIFFYWLFLFI